jgi:hypothetical protein
MDVFDKISIQFKVVLFQFLFKFSKIYIFNKYYTIELKYFWSDYYLMSFYSFRICTFKPIFTIHIEQAAIYIHSLRLFRVLLSVLNDAFAKCQARLGLILSGK